MRKIGVLVLAAATAMVLAVGSGSAVAASPAAEACAAEGGTYTKAPGSTASCVFPEESVANENANPDNNGRTVQTTDTGQGNLNNNPESTCTGPPGQCAQQ
jgi:hypothetical protein